MINDVFWRFIPITFLITFLTALVFPQSLLQNEFINLELRENMLLLLNKLTNTPLQLPLSSIKLKLADEWLGGEKLEIKEIKKAQSSCKIVFKPLKSQRTTLFITLNLSLSRNLLRKWLTLKTGYLNEPLPLLDVVLEGFRPPDEPETFPSWWQSQPVIGSDYFLGIEFPVAYWRKEGEFFVLGHQPGVLLKGETNYESRKEVIGVAPQGKAREWFEEYIDSLRPSPKGIHFNYNTWWSLPVIYGEKEALNLIAQWRRAFYETYGVSLDTFTLDAGWSEPKSIWRISNKRFPNGFANLRKELERMGTKLGLWVSPSSCYHPFTQDLQWAQENGYEIFKSGEQPYACLAKGNRYQEAMKEALVDLVKRYNIHQLKLDGYVPECPSDAHNHLPGSLSREAVAEGLMDICRTVRGVQPQIWLEATCFGWDPSPWWLMVINSVVGPFGDDAPYGRIPSLIYRQSYTSARDFYNLHDKTPIPMRAKEVLGIIHQTTEPLYDDAVITVMRGHFFISLYINPRFMEDTQWRFLAQLISWLRRNEGILRNTTIIRPKDWRVSSNDWTRDKMSRLPYGYVHWGGGKSLICLRNPFIEESTFELNIDSSLGISPTAGSLSLVRLYPTKEILASGLSFGDSFPIQLYPYETTILALIPKNLQPIRMSPPLIEVKDFSFKLENVKVKEIRPPYGANYTSLIGEADKYFRLSGEGIISLPEGGKILALLEYPSSFPNPPYARAWFNQKEVKVEVISSEMGWASSGPYSKNEYWAFVVVPLRGFGRFKLEIYSKDNAKLSLWALSEGKRSDMVSFEDDFLSFPSRPEWRATRSLRLIPPMELEDGEEVEGELPMEYLPEGIYLDTMEPVEAKQDWGELQRNRSVQGNLLKIGSKVFMRGLGTHANSRIVYRIEGKYKRFTAYVGADREVSGNTIIFEVWGDGRKLWDSGLMSIYDEPRKVDLDISGVEILELRVSDGGDGITADHADWADAVLY